MKLFAIATIAWVGAGCFRGVDLSPVGYRCQGDIDCADNLSCVLGICGGVDLQPALPVRISHYSTNFPLDWASSRPSGYHPLLGQYDSRDPVVIASHIRSMEYGHISVGVVSWPAANAGYDPLVLLLTATGDGGFRWAIEYEPEFTDDPAPAQLAQDVQQIASTYGNQPAYFRIQGRFVVIVHGSGSDRCLTDGGTLDGGIVERWTAARALSGLNPYLLIDDNTSNGGKGCANRLEAWLEARPGVAYDPVQGVSVSISPGYWATNDPDGGSLPRDVAQWNANLAKMVATGWPYQFATSFNDWSRGNAIEAATEWASDSGQGLYLDALSQY